MASKNRGNTGQQLPTPFYQSLESAGIRFWRSQLCLVVGPGSAGKSLFISNLVAKWGRPTLAFLLDQDQATAAARFAATELDENFLELKKDLDAEATTAVLGRLGYIQTDYKAETLGDVQLHLDAYIERYGEPPHVLVIDNLGNMTSGYDDEWSTLKALTLELDMMARAYEMIVIAAHHTTDAPTTEPLPRSSILGKISQYPRLILSVAFNPFSAEYKLAAVKNSSGPTDAMASNPLVFDANPANMQVTERAKGDKGFTPSEDYLAAFRGRGGD
jgi:AAA domain